MKWTRGHRSDDVEVRTGNGGGGALPGGVLALIASRFGIGGALLAMLAFAAFQYFSAGSDAPAPAQGQQAAVADERVQFVSFVLDDVQKTWAQKLPGYRKAKLIVFTGATQTGCGYGDRAVGPFYCPTDGNVYLDLAFFQTLTDRLGARGDFAQAYVVAHEIGHHVQNLTGLDRPTSNAQSVKVELQADCYAGVWAHSTAQRDLLEQGDFDEAVTAAQAIGDDRLQKQATGTVRPEKWTHGSSAQRAAWFKRGYASGNPEACDTMEQARR